MRVTLTRHGRPLASGEIVDADPRSGAFYVVLDGQPGQRFRFNRVRKRDGVHYMATARSLRGWGKVRMEPEERHAREQAAAGGVQASSL